MSHFTFIPPSVQAWTTYDGILQDEGEVSSNVRPFIISSRNTLVETAWSTVPNLDNALHPLQPHRQVAAEVQVQFSSIEPSIHGSLPLPVLIKSLLFVTSSHFAFPSLSVIYILSDWHALPRKTLNRVFDLVHFRAFLTPSWFITRSSDYTLPIGRAWTWTRRWKKVGKVQPRHKTFWTKNMKPHPYQGLHRWRFVPCW